MDLHLLRNKEKVPQVSMLEAGLSCIQRVLPRVLEKTAFGEKVYIPVGSRSIPDFPFFLTPFLRLLRDAGRVPVLVACMGGHGLGGSRNLQKEFLAELGITDALAPILYAEKAKHVGYGPSEILLWLHPELVGKPIFLMNKIAEHTHLSGKLQSGLCKMAAVGMGGLEGAHSFHRLIEKYGEVQSTFLLEMLAEAVLGCTTVLGVFGFLENAYGGIGDVVNFTLPFSALDEEEALGRAKKLAPKLPMKDPDLLVINDFGKSFSGTGVSTVLLGIKSGIKKYKKLYLRNLIGGNGTGMLLADGVSSDVLENVDMEETLANESRAGFTPPPLSPNVIFGSDRLAFKELLKDGKKVLILRNTKEMDLVLSSVPLSGWEVLKTFPLEFTASGTLKGLRALYDPNYRR